MIGCLFGLCLSKIGEDNISGRENDKAEKQILESMGFFFSAKYFGWTNKSI